MTEAQMIAKLDSVLAYAEGLTMEVIKMKKQISRGVVKKKNQAVSNDELNRISARFQQRLIKKGHSIL